MDSPKSLAFASSGSWDSKGFIPSECFKINVSGIGTNWHSVIRLSRFISETVQVKTKIVMDHCVLSAGTNISDLGWSWTAIRHSDVCLLESTTKIWIKIYTIGSSSVSYNSSSWQCKSLSRYLRLFNGEGVKWELGRWKRRFSLLNYCIFQTFTAMARIITLYYVVPH